MFNSALTTTRILSGRFALLALLFGLTIPQPLLADSLAPVDLAEGDIAILDTEGEEEFTQHILHEARIWWPSQLSWPADVDGDGDTDIIASTRVGGAIWLFENSGGADPTFTLHTVDYTGATRAVFAADFNGDGRMDLLTGSSADGSGELRWYQNNGGSPPSFTKHVIPSAGSDFYAAEAGDVDGDGDMDIVAFHLNDFGSKPLMTMWFENQGGFSPTFVEHQLTNISGWHFSIHVADLDGDGDQDIVQGGGPYSGLAAIVWYEQIAPKNFSAHILANVGVRVEVGPPVDVDRDGDLDLFAAIRDEDDGSASRFVWYENNGAAPPSFAEHVILSESEAAGPEYIFPSDIDGDGDIDAVATYETEWVSESGIYAWFESDGAAVPSFTLHVVGNVAPPLFSWTGAGWVTTADFNGDGAPDILGQESERLSWFENALATARNNRYLDVRSLPDINGNLSPEIAALLKLPDGQPQVIIKDSDTKKFIARMDFGNPNQTAKGVTGLLDITGNGAPEVAVLLTRRDGVSVVQMRDGKTGRWIDKIYFFCPPWESKAVTSQDLNLDGVSEISVLATRPDGKVATKIKDSISKELINWVPFPGTTD
jgi:hypothetical protein